MVVKKQEKDDSDTWVMHGKASYYLRDDIKVVRDKVVPKFLTSCKVETQHIEMFTEGLRYDHACTD